MSIKKLTAVAVAALGLSLGAYSASAGPLNGGLALSSEKAPSTFTLVRMGGGGHGGGFGGGHMGGGFSGGHMGGGFGGGMGHSFGGMRGPGSMGMSRIGPGVGGFYGSRAGIYRPGIASRGIYAGRGIHGGRTAVWHGHRGYWRHGRFFPFVGVGLWGSDYGYGGGSCYWNCRSAGFGPGYCSVYAYNYCY